MNVDEARALIDESDGHPVVRWRDKNERWRFGYLVEVGNKWAKIRIGNGKEFPYTNQRVLVEKIVPRRK